MTAPGLRERKKQETRARLSDAAWLLAAERGVGAVTVEDIASKADVSPRTFFNYFSTKEEAVLDRSRKFGLGLAAGLRARPAEEPLHEAVAVAGTEIVTELNSLPNGWLSKLRRMRDENPELIPHQLAIYEAVARSLAEAIAERTGTDVERDMYPQLAAGCVLMTWRVAFSRWCESDSTTDLMQGWRAALRQLASGMSEPRHG